MRALRAARPRSRGRGSMARRAFAVVGGVLWWCAVLRLAARPESAGTWHGAMVAGWSLGLIPLHAVPQDAGPTGTGPRTPPAPGQPPAGAGPRWQRGHQ